MEKIVKRANGSIRVLFDTGRESLTVQSAKDQCDINKLISRYQKTGQLPPVAHTNGVYGDFSGVKDYHTAMNAILSAQESFQTLSAEVRKRFDNDPAKLLSFLNDPKNDAEAIKLGLVNPKVEEPQPPTPVVNPPADSDKK